MIVAWFRGGVPLWVPDRFWYWLEARDERRATAPARELEPLGRPPRRIVCPSCGVPFFRHGGARSSCFYRTREENDTCLPCRESLDPVTLEPKLSGKIGGTRRPLEAADQPLTTNTAQEAVQHD